MTRTPWTDHDVRRLRSYVKSGLSDPDIGEALGRSPRSIAIKRARLGLVSKRLHSVAGSVRDFASSTLRRELRRRGYSVSAAPVRKPSQAAHDIPSIYDEPDKPGGTILL